MITGIWEEFLHIIKEEAGSRVVETWFKAVSLEQWDPSNKVVYLCAPNQFVRDWIQTNYLSLMQYHLGRLLHVELPKIIIRNAQEKNLVTVENKEPESFAISFAKAAVVPTACVKVRADNENRPVSRKYSFDNFVVGPNNSLAYAAAHAVTEKPGRLYNPLFFYGGSGLGKTHLLHAIGNEIKEKNKSAVVLYQSTDRFINEFINAIRFDTMHKFHAKYKEVDVLLIDDIQFISKKEQTQEAFFHIFNSLYESHKQIIFSSDTFPHNIEGLAERLRSRLAWGLVVDIHMPSLETRVAIIKKKAETSNEQLDDDVAHFIASRELLNIRELEGALVRVMAFASLTKQAITLELAQKVLMKLPEAQSHAIDFDKVIKCVGKHYAYNVHDLKSKSRNKELSFVRQLTMFLMKKVTDKSLRDIGDFLGGRDHSTVMHAINKIEEQFEIRADFLAHVNKIEQEIKQL